MNKELREIKDCNMRDVFEVDIDESVVSEQIGNGFGDCDCAQGPANGTAVIALRNVKVSTEAAVA